MEGRVNAPPPCSLRHGGWQGILGAGLQSWEKGSHTVALAAGAWEKQPKGPEGKV